jgi:hypothetical protein
LADADGSALENCYLNQINKIDCGSKKKNNYRHSTPKTDAIKVGLDFLISNFFINEMSLVNIWMNLAVI